MTRPSKEDPLKTSRDKGDIRKIVRERYVGIATGAKSGCGCATPSCCSPQTPAAKAQSAKLGYSKQELEAAPDGADMGLGCGNPQAIAGLRKGEVVLDLGAGGGFDCFLAARQVGARGRVKEASLAFIKDWFPGSGIERYVRSADVQGVKPKEKQR